MVSKPHRLQYFYLDMCCMYIFFPDSKIHSCWFLLFFRFTISGARLDGVISGEGEEGRSADAAINFTLMMISLSESLRNCFGR